MPEGSGISGNSHQRKSERKREARIKEQVTSDLLQQFHTMDGKSITPGSLRVEDPIRTTKEKWIDFIWKAFIAGVAAALSLFASLVLQMYGVDDPVIGRLALAAFACCLLLLSSLIAIKYCKSYILMAVLIIAVGCGLFLGTNM